MRNQDNANVYQVHGRVFRIAMSDLRVAKNFLENYLPKNLLEKIDLTTLQLCHENYVTKKLKLLSTDVLFSVKLKNKTDDSQGLIFILLEHLSNFRKFTLWRMLKYTTVIMEDQHNNNPEGYLPVVIPIIVYNGVNRNSNFTDIYQLFHPAHRELVKEFMLNQIQVIDFSGISDEVMRQHQWSGLMELLMKHSRSPELMRYAESMSKQFKELLIKAENYTIGLLHYIIAQAENIDEIEFQDFIQKISTSIGEDKTMTLAQIWEQRGRQEGIQQGIEQGIEKGLVLGKQEERHDIAKKLLKASNDFGYVQKITGLDFAIITTIKKQIELEVED